MDEQSDRPHPWEQGLLPYVPAQTSQTIRRLAKRVEEKAEG